ncbi:hypothetical protein CF319_g4669 [Tilletia indica]|nr:hypothetical protein CF319_g4669 [Tilletia indica]KAE8228148.1 hypothetical protein CF326_g6930 [Tilletia indica]
MPAPKVLSLEDARVAIEEFIHNLSNGDRESSFSAAALDSASLRLIDLTRSEDGRYSSIVCEMQATDKMANGLGNVHGGCVATIVDCITSACLYCHTSNEIPDPWSMLGVSQSLSIVYLSPLPIEQYMDIIITVGNVGRSISVTQAEIWVKDGKGGKRLRKAALGTHTKVDNSSQAKL